MRTVPSSNFKPLVVRRRTIHYRQLTIVIVESLPSVTRGGGVHTLGSSNGTASLNRRFPIHE